MNETKIQREQIYFFPDPDFFRNITIIFCPLTHPVDMGILDLMRINEVVFHLHTVVVALKGQCHEMVNCGHWWLV
jgi:hypothetical protein